jgi:hypothetical protein
MVVDKFHVAGVHVSPLSGFLVILIRISPQLPQWAML